MEKKYHCYTDQGSWYYYASNDLDSLRLALFICWRDGEIFDHVLTEDGRTFRICSIDRHGNIETLP